MDTYRNIDSVKQFGVLHLTGEACGLNMRCLCDLTQEGVDLWQEFTRTTPTSDAWNRQGIKSVMIPYCMFEDLWIFAKVRKGKKYVFKGNYTFGNCVSTAHATNNEEIMSTINEHVKEGRYEIHRWYTKSKQPGTGIDNQHVMSGRVQ
jgi:predicted small metal-binding protein